MSHEPDPREKRRSIRVSGKEMRACCQVAHFMDVYGVENLSTGGALLSYGIPLPVGQAINVSVVSDDHDPVVARAQVVRHVSDGAAELMAIAFSPNAKTYDAIHNIVVDALFQAGGAV